MQNLDRLRSDIAITTLPINIDLRMSSSSFENYNVSIFIEGIILKCSLSFFFVCARKKTSYYKKQSAKQYNNEWHCWYTSYSTSCTRLKWLTVFWYGQRRFNRLKGLERFKFFNSQKELVLNSHQVIKKFLNVKSKKKEKVNQIKGQILKANIILIVKKKSFNPYLSSKHLLEIHFCKINRFKLYNMAISIPEPVYLI